MAETEGFEPSMELLTPYSLSRGAPSASRASLRDNTLGPSAVEGRKNTGSMRNRQTSVRVFVPGGRRGFLAVDALVDLFAVDRDILGRGDAHAHLVALDAKHGHGDGVTDHERLANPPGQNQHWSNSMGRDSARSDVEDRRMRPSLIVYTAEQ